MSQAQTRFESIMPEMPVRNLTAAIDFYARVLGFRQEYVHGDEYAVMKRDGVLLGLIRQRPDAQPGQGRAYAFVSGIDDYYEGVRAAGARVTDPLERRPYGLKDFVIADPDGNRLAFGSEL